MELLTQTQDYLRTEKPLEISDFTLSHLGSGEYNTNFLLSTASKKYVVRVSRDQLSGAADQLMQEYLTLDYLKDYELAPQPFFIDMDTFAHPLMIEEFIEGEELNNLNNNTLRGVGSLIARINNVEIKEYSPFEQRQPDYMRDIESHEALYTKLNRNNVNAQWFDETGELIAAAKDLLKNKPAPDTPMLIRRDANPANFIISHSGIHMVDWEITRVDDPTITLASFINELTLYDIKNLKPGWDDIDVVKQAFLEECPLLNFDEFLANRLVVEELGGLIWGLERIDNLVSQPTQPTNSHERLEWYQTIASRSVTALKQSLAR